MMKTYTLRHLAASGTLFLLLSQSKSTRALDLLDGMASAVFYEADTDPLGDSAAASGSTLFVPKWEGLDSAPNDVVCFVGRSNGLEPDVESAHGGGGNDCTAANGCGVHVHSGTDCATTETQGGHWYNEDVLTDDPWKYVGYKQTSSGGIGRYASCVRTGYNVASKPSLLEGRAFIIHSEDGSRVSCGLISQAIRRPKVFEAHTTPIPGTDSGVTGHVAVLGNIGGSREGVCYVGVAQGLEPNIESFLLSDESEQCKAVNGCGAHIHAGTGCATKDEQGGHYYNGAELTEDPWLLESYWSTDGDGAAALVGCLITGKKAKKYRSRPFIIHGEDGGRLSCGNLKPTPRTDSLRHEPLSPARAVLEKL